MIGGMGTSADAGDAPLAPGHTPYLPEPTGPGPVGTTSLYLKDVSRPDPWAAGVNARELMVSLWYPAAPSDGRRARYMTPAESELQLTSRGITGIPQDALSTVRTNAVGHATPAGRQRALPLVVSRPFLFLGKQSNYTPGGEGAVTTWERDWKRLTGWKRWLLVAGAIHASFTDRGHVLSPGDENLGTGTRRRPWPARA